MKILWITNMLLPDAAEYLDEQTGSSGTWMIDISRKLAQGEDTELAVACIHGDEYRVFDHAGIRWYLLPGTGKTMLFYTKSLEKLWKRVRDDFAPDLVHIHGTEYSHGLAFMRACPEIKAIISVQGILNRIKDVDFGGLPRRHFIFGRTFRQYCRLNGEYELHCLHCINAKHEREMLERAYAINGVNVWDTSLCKSINPSLKVYKIEYNLRDEMYDSPKWSLDAVRRHTIFTNPGGTPLKGVHQLLEAVALLKDKYPDILVRVPGMGRDGRLTVASAYAKYIQKRIKSLGLENHVEFLGRQTGAQMCENMLTAHATVIPSAIEGTSLILREAMFLGCPCIASFRGGMADFIADKQDGFLYDYQEYPVLAARLDELFSNDELAKRFSAAAIEKATVAHDRERNVADYIAMYHDI
ncbi:MAG: glycosyltransferase [Clostridia bacterium]|nr:glycosyltransferase [Clostridia bacterium]